MHYRSVRGKDADELTTKLEAFTDPKSGKWHVVGVVRDGQLYVAFLEGEAYPEPPPQPPPLSQEQQELQDEIDRVKRLEQGEDWAD